MRIGCNTVAFRRHPVEFALEQVAAAGYDYVEVEANLSWCPHVDPWQDDPAAFAEMVAGYGFRGVSALGSHRELITDDQSVADLVQALRWSSEAGIPIVVTGEGRLPPGMALPTALGILAERLSILVGAARQYGVRIAIEDHGSISLGSLEGLPRILDLVDSEWLVVNFDTANIHRGDYVGTDRSGYGWKLDTACSYDEVELLRRVLARVAHLHVKDVVGRDAVILGQGEVNLDGCIDLLREASFDGILSYETEGNEDAERAAVMINASREFLAGAIESH
ncbi:MAG: sugar phosphate isomerase/epimerase family protein [Acidimicrobiales bacterium]